MATPSPFGANARRYRKVPKRAKNPKTQSGCFIEVATVITLIVAAILN